MNCYNLADAAMPFGGEWQRFISCWKSIVRSCNPCCCRASQQDDSDLPHVPLESLVVPLLLSGVFDTSCCCCCCSAGYKKSGIGREKGGPEYGLAPHVQVKAVYQQLKDTPWR